MAQLQLKLKKHYRWSQTLEHCNPLARVWLGEFPDPVSKLSRTVLWVDLQWDSFEFHLQQRRGKVWAERCFPSSINPDNDTIELSEIKYSMNLIESASVECNATELLDIVICEEPSQIKCSSIRDCHEHAKCIKGRCLCDPGFAGDGYHCADVDECQTIAYKWLMKMGLTRNFEGQTFVDVHGCKRKTCRNTYGSYHCYNCIHNCPKDRVMYPVSRGQPPGI